MVFLLLGIGAENLFLPSVNSINCNVPCVSAQLLSARCLFLFLRDLKIVSSISSRNESKCNKNVPNYLRQRKAILPQFDCICATLANAQEQMKHFMGNNGINRFCYDYYYYYYTLDSLLLFLAFRKTVSLPSATCSMLELGQIIKIS